MTVSKALVSAGFSFALPASVTRDVPASTPVSVTREDGKALPSWLHFDRDSMVFAATSVPSGGLPLRVVILLGGHLTVVTIAEQN